jgi:hypothetical protein
MIRAKFLCQHDMAHPVRWPPPGPYWLEHYDVSGFAHLVAYAANEVELRKFWPDLWDLSYEITNDIMYDDEYPKPEWWP